MRNRSVLDNIKQITEDNVKDDYSQKFRMKSKNTVDINILLNRVRLKEKQETKRRIIFFSSTIFMIFLFGAFIGILK